MVQSRRGSELAQRQSPRRKRRRLNLDSPQPSKEKRTPTRTSPRFSRQAPVHVKSPDTVKWERELPNATAAVDRALLKISSCREAQTADLCDEIADYLTQALFEDVWCCESVIGDGSKPDSGELKAQELGSGRKDQHSDRENVEPNVRKSPTPKEQRGTVSTSNSTPQVIVLGPVSPSPPSSRRKPEKRKLSNGKTDLDRQENERNKKEPQEQERGKTVPTKHEEQLPEQGGKRRSDRPKIPICNGGLVEEVVEIEELYVDGGVASERTPKAHHNVALEGEIEEQVLDRSESKSVTNSEENDATPPVRIGTRLPWWRISKNDLEGTSKSEKELLGAYVTAIARTCVRETWNAETLKESYTRDPKSNRGQAFVAVHASLQLLERAKHAKECETRWRPELLRELLQRQEVDWSILRPDKKFDQFAGCDACLGHRRATARLWLKGKRYDASDFWPGTSRLNVLSSRKINDRKVSVSAELRGETTNDHLIHLSANENNAEFWVDSNCLRKCLLFHELVHSTASIARDFRRTIKNNLGRGTVELKLSSKESKGNGMSVSERLERHLLRSVLHDKDYVQDHVDHLTDIIRLGDVYFSSPDAEVLDSGKSGKSVYVPSIYDAPLDLGDEDYKHRIDKVVARSRRES